MNRVILTSTFDHLKHLDVFFAFWRLLEESTESPILIKILLLNRLEENIVTNLLHVVNKFLVVSLLETDRIFNILLLSVQVVSFCTILLVFLVFFGITH